MRVLGIPLGGCFSKCGKCGPCGARRREAKETVTVRQAFKGSGKERRSEAQNRETERERER